MDKDFNMNEFESKVYIALLKKYTDEKNKHDVIEWMIFPQVRTHTGGIENYGGDRIIDFFIMNMLPSKKYKCIAIEVKESIYDLRNDWQDVNKQISARFYSDEFYYLISKEMDAMHSKELNEYFFKKGCNDGLMIYTEETNTIRIVKRKTNKEKSPFSFGFVASLIRNVDKRKRVD
jgi:hypothetical protein